MNPMQELEKINCIASERVSMALRKIVHEDIEVSLSSPQLLDLSHVDFFVDLKQYGVGIYLPIHGVRGSAIFLFPEEVSYDLCYVMLKREVDKKRKSDRFDQAILKELGNILIGNYLAVFSNEFGKEIMGGAPKFSSGLFGAILEGVLANIMRVEVSVLVVKIEFKSKPNVFVGQLILLWENQDVQDMLGPFGESNEKKRSGNG